MRGGAFSRRDPDLGRRAGTFGTEAGKVLDEEATYWIFSDMEENSFHWEYVTLNPDGSRNLVCEIFGRRTTE